MMSNKTNKDTLLIAFISDLHLSSNCPEQFKLLQQFLLSNPQIESLYILGDLFDVWTGDDMTSTFEHSVAQLLKTFSANRSVYFMAGNRDYLLGKKFARAANLTLLKDPHLLALQNETVLLTHGDQLCTLDKSYQRFRTVAQSTLGKMLFLCLPKKWRKSIAKKARQKSQSHKSTTDLVTMDVEHNTVSKWFNDHHADIIIHGHTHQKALHQHVTGSTSKTRWVLGDWKPTEGNALLWQASSGFKTITF